MFLFEYIREVSGASKNPFSGNVQEVKLMKLSIYLIRLNHNSESETEQIIISTYLNNAPLREENNDNRRWQKILRPMSSMHAEGNAGSAFFTGFIQHSTLYFYVSNTN